MELITSDGNWTGIWKMSRHWVCGAGKAGLAGCASNQALGWPSRTGSHTQSNTQASVHFLQKRQQETNWGASSPMFPSLPWKSTGPGSHGCSAGEMHHLTATETQPEASASLWTHELGKKEWREIWVARNWFRGEKNASAKLPLRRSLNGETEVRKEDRPMCMTGWGWGLWAGVCVCDSNSVQKTATPWLCTNYDVRWMAASPGEASQAESCNCLKDHTLNFCLQSNSSM